MDSSNIPAAWVILWLCHTALEPPKHTNTTTCLFSHIATDLGNPEVSPRLPAARGSFLPFFIAVSLVADLASFHV